MDMYYNNEQFRRGCLKTTHEILSTKISYHKDLSVNLSVGVKYLLYELPLYINSPYIFDVKSSLFIYHEHFSFIKKLITDSTFTAPNQGLLTVKICGVIK